MGRFSKLLNDTDALLSQEPVDTASDDLGTPQDLIALASKTPVMPVTPTVIPKSSKEDDWLNTKIKMHSRLIDEIDLTALDGMETPALQAKD